MEDLTFYESVMLRHLHSKDSIPFPSEVDQDLETILKETPLQAYCRRHPDAVECRVYDL